MIHNIASFPCKCLIMQAPGNEANHNILYTNVQSELENQHAVYTCIHVPAACNIT